MPNLKKNIKTYLLDNYGLKVKSFRLNTSGNSYTLQCVSNFSDSPIEVTTSHLNHIDKHLHIIYVKDSKKRWVNSLSKYFPSYFERHSEVKSFFENLENINAYFMNFSLKKYLKADHFDCFKPEVFSFTLGHYHDDTELFDTNEKLLFGVYIHGQRDPCTLFIRIEKNLVKYTICEHGKESKPFESTDLKALSNQLLSNCQNILNYITTPEIYDFSQIEIDNLSEIPSLIEDHYNIKMIVKY